jgi:hypothetical protein
MTRGKTDEDLQREQKQEKERVENNDRVKAHMMRAAKEMVAMLKDAGHANASLVVQSEGAYLAIYLDKNNEGYRNEAIATVQAEYGWYTQRTRMRKPYITVGSYRPQKYRTRKDGTYNLAAAVKNLITRDRDQRAMRARMNREEIRAKREAKQLKLRSEKMLGTELHTSKTEWNHETRTYSRRHFWGKLDRVTGKWNITADLKQLSDEAARQIVQLIKELTGTETKED